MDLLRSVEKILSYELNHLGWDWVKSVHRRQFKENESVLLTLLNRHDY